MASIGENIKRLRLNAGISQEELGNRIGKTRSAISQYESDSIVPRMGVVEELAALFHVPKSEIIDEDESINQKSYRLTPEEIELIEIYRNLDYTSKLAIRQLAETLSPKTEINSNKNTNGNVA